MPDVTDAYSVSCPACGADVPEEAVSVEHGAATCPACCTPFALPKRKPKPKLAPERRIPMPKSISIESGEPPLRPAGGYRDPAVAPLPELVIRRRWFRWQVLFLSGFALVWDGFLVTWYVGMFSMGEFHPMGICFPLVHVGVGVGITYYAAALWVNSTVLHIHDGVLSVRHGPLPWRGNCEVPVSSVRQLLHQRRVHNRQKGGTQITWEVHALTDTHEDIQLLRGLSDIDEARYIEWVVEEHLGIEDDPSQNLT